MRLLITTQTVDKNDPILGFFHGWILEFAKYFDRIDIICLYEGTHELPAHVRVHSLGKEEGKSRLTYTVRFYRYFWHIYMKQGVDHVFFHMGAIYNSMAAPFFFIRKLKKTKFYWWKAHGHINWAGRMALLFVNEVVTSTESGFPVNTRKRRIVGQAIDTTQFNLKNNPETNFKILFVGRVSRVKRIEQVIAVLKELRKKDERYTVKIIGPVSDTEYYTELREYIKKENVSTCVQFLNGVSQQELVSEYQEASVLINPSDTDSMDKVVLEAMACGCIPVTANRAFKEILSPYALHMEKGDTDGYTQCVERITKMSPAERSNIKEELRAEVVKNHALETLPKRIFGVG